MLAAVRWPSVLMGVGAGVLLASLIALIVGGLASLLGGSASIGLVPGILLGFASGGFVAGRSAIHSHRFHGSLVGLAMAAIVVLIALGGGSPAPVGQVLLLAFFGVVAGGIGGALGGRRENAARR